MASGTRTQGPDPDRQVGVGLAGPVSVDPSLVERAVSLLGASRRPLFAGLATDVAGMRAALDLAERCGGVTDHLHGAARMINLVPLQQHGGQLTTLAEVRNRADLINFVGGEPLAAFPRFEERILAPAGSFIDPAIGRRCVRIGANQAVNLPVALDLPGDLHDVMALLDTTLMLLDAGGADPAKPLPGHLASRPDLPAARAWLQLLQASAYPVFIWAAANWPVALGQRLSLRLMRLVSALNRKGRAAALPMGGNDGEASAEAVHLWRTGFPLRSAFTPEGVRFDPVAHDAAGLLARGDVDSLVWISGLGIAHPPPDTSLPSIVLGPPGMANSASVFIPVGTPGIDHDSHLVRMDRVVTMYLRQTGAVSAIRERLPSVAQVLQAVLSGLQAASSMPVAD